MYTHPLNSRFARTYSLTSFALRSLRSLIGIRYRSFLLLSHTRRGGVIPAVISLYSKVISLSCTRAIV